MTPVNTVELTILCGGFISPACCVVVVCLPTELPTTVCCLNRAKQSPPVSVFYLLSLTLTPIFQ